MNKDDFLDAICEMPSDVLTKQAYIDWLMERGEDKEARAWQWIIDHKKMPEDRTHNRPESEREDSYSKPCWDWWHISSEKRNCWKLENGIYTRLSSRDKFYPYMARYETQQLAWEDLVRVLMEVNNVA